MLHIIALIGFSFFGYYVMKWLINAVKKQDIDLKNDKNPPKEISSMSRDVEQAIMERTIRNLVKPECLK